MTPETSYDIQKLLNNFVVRIPKIQREYAQGRKEEKAEAIRKTFVGVLLDAVSKENGSLHVDLVYGVSTKSADNKPSFLPIDGQQRLTTLYLLAWFCGTNMSGWKFDYKARRAAQSFMDGLMNNPRKGEKPSEELRQSTWFHDSWTSDPSVDGMIEVLDEMYKQNSDSVDELSKTMHLDRIHFFIEEGICGSEMDEEQAEKSYGHLFLKMNARGLPLTDWEVTKNAIDKHADDSSLWKLNVNGTWQENLWPFTTSQVDDADLNIKTRVSRLDVAMLGIVTMCARFCGEQGVEDFDVRLKQLNRKGKKDSFFEWCANSFQFVNQIAGWWCQDRRKNTLWQVSSKDENQSKSNREAADCDNTDEFAEWLTKGAPSFAEQLRFAFLVKGKTLERTNSSVVNLLQRRLRVLLNLLDASTISNDTFDKALQAGLSFLSGDSNKDVEWLRGQNAGYSREQLNDEIWKWSVTAIDVVKHEKDELVHNGSLRFIGWEPRPFLSAEDIGQRLKEVREEIQNNENSFFINLVSRFDDQPEELVLPNSGDKPRWQKSILPHPMIIQALHNWHQNKTSPESVPAWVRCLKEVSNLSCFEKIKKKTTHKGWRFLIMKEKTNLTNGSIRLDWNDAEFEKMKQLLKATSPIVYSSSPNWNFLKASSNDDWFNVEDDTWFQNRPPKRFSKKADGTFELIPDSGKTSAPPTSPNDETKTT